MKDKKIKLYLVYTALFAVMCMAIFGVFFMNDKTFIWKKDGINQHYTAMLYYARYLRSIIKNVLIHHNLNIPTYSASIGYGSDIVTTLSYYGLGDPVTFLCVFVPMKYMVHFYDGSIILRFYLAGLTFLSYCLYRKGSKNYEGEMSNIGILTGTFVYVFCGYALYAGIKHPFFLNPMIYFPMVALGVEKIIDDKRPYIFSLGVFLGAVSNFYFFYMIVIFTVLYVAVRLLAVFGMKNIKTIIMKICKLAIYSVIGVGMSCAVFLPTVVFFLSGERSDKKIIAEILYNKFAYQTLFRDFISNNTGAIWRHLGYASIALVALIILFMQKKKHRDLKALFIILTIGLMLPGFSYLMNGFLYVSNRWTWGYSFVVAFAVVSAWQYMDELSAKQILMVSALLLAYLVICFVHLETRNSNAYLPLAIAFAIIFILLQISNNSMKKETGEIMIICLVCFNIWALSQFRYSPHNGDYVSDFMEKASVEKHLNHSETVVLDKLVKTDDFYRYQGADITKNNTLHTGYSSTQYYWSLSDGKITKYRRLMNLMVAGTYSYENLDDRTILSNLANARYNISRNTHMYGYKKVGSQKNYKNINDYLKKYAGISYPKEKLTTAEKNMVKKKITRYQLWEDKNALPFGYTYKDYISKNTFEKLSDTDKQEALLQAVVLEKDDAKEKENFEYSSVEIPYKIKVSGGVKQEGNRFKVLKNNSYITLNFEGKENVENYVQITNMQYKPMNKLDTYTELEWKMLSTYDKNKKLYESQYYKLDNGPEYYSSVPTSRIKVVAYDGKSKVRTKEFTYKTPYDSYYTGRKNFIINFGYRKKRITSARIYFEQAGEYTMDDLQVFCQPMENYKKQVKELAKDSLKNVDFHNDRVFHATNTITADIDLKEQKYVLLSLPYSSGWTAYVDGKKEKIEQANIMFMALKLTPGKHDIVLKYETPGLRAGILISILCFALLLVSRIIGRKRT